MFNLIKANLYRFKKSKRYMWSILIMYIVGILGVISMVQIASVDRDIFTLGLGTERLVISCCLIVMPICFINFFYKRDDAGLNKKELLVVKERYQLVLSDSITIFIVNLLVISIFLFITILVLSSLGNLPRGLVHNLFYIICKATLLISCITECSMIFEYWLGSFLLPVIIVILIVTGNMHIIIKFLLDAIGYGNYALFTLSGLAMYYEYNDFVIPLLLMYTVLYNAISMVVISRKEY